MVRAKRSDKSILIGVICGIAVVAILLYFLFPLKTISFREGFSDFDELDEKYETDFHKEKVNSTTMVARDKIQDYKESVNDLKEELSGYRNTSDVRALLLFADIRNRMLSSYEYFYEASDIGDIGLVDDGFRCGEMPYILKATDFYNKTWYAAMGAQILIDRLLNQYGQMEDVDGVIELVGVSANKTGFYKSDLGSIAGAVRVNLYGLRKYCGYNFEGDPFKVSAFSEKGFGVI